MANNLKDLSNEKRKEIANSPAIYDFLVAAYSLRQELLGYVREATSVTDAQDRAREAKGYINDLMKDLGSSEVTPGKTLNDAIAAIKKAESLDVPETTCKPPLRYDPVTGTCVPM